MALVVLGLGAAPASAQTGTIGTVAGTGTAGFSGDGGPATSAQLNFPPGVAVAADGDVLIADQGNHRVRRVDAATGTITTIAGTGTAGFSGDGGPATSAQLDLPNGVAVASDGDVLIADMSNDRVRRVDATTGVISTVAGSGVPGFSGDAGPATSAQLNLPHSVAVAADDSILIADTYNQRVRRVDAATGTITTIAGTGTFGFSGDGGPATSAQLSFPVGVAVAPDGSILIADTTNQRVRRVAPDGAISTLAGTGTSGSAGDGGPATSAQLDNPFGVAVAPDGDVLIADRGNDRVRRVDAGLLAPADGCHPSVAADEPVACWRMAEPDGTTMVDSTGNGHDGEYLGGVLLGQLGVFPPDTAAQFDGVDDLGRVPDSDGLDVGDTFALEAWIKRSSDGRTHQLFNKGKGAYQLVVMNAGAGSQVFLRKAGVTTVARSTAGIPADGEFHHVVATSNDDGQSRIYVDGSSEGSVGVSQVQVFRDTAFPLHIGGYGSTPATFDELAIYDEHLTGSEVTAHHQAAVPPIDP